MPVGRGNARDDTNVLLKTDFENADLTADWGSVGTNFSSSTSFAYSGSRSLRGTAAAGTTYMDSRVIGDKAIDNLQPTRLSWSFRWYADSAGAAAAGGAYGHYCPFVGDDAAAIAYINFFKDDATGAMIIRLVDIASSLVTTVSCSNGAWHLSEIEVVTGANGYLNWRVDGVLVVSQWANPTNVNRRIRNHNFGGDGSPAGSYNSTHYYDDMSYVRSGFLADGTQQLVGQPCTRPRAFAPGLGR